MSQPRITSERSEVLYLATKSYIPTSRIHLPGNANNSEGSTSTTQWEVHRSLRGGVAWHTQTRIYSTIIGVCSLWLIYRFIKDFLCVEDAHKIKEMKRLSTAKEGAEELEEEMDGTQVTEEEARNEIAKLEAGFKQAGNNKTFDIISMGYAAKSPGGRGRLSLEQAQIRYSAEDAAEPPGAGRRLSLKSLARENEGEQDSVDVVERTRSISDLNIPVSEVKDVPRTTNKPDLLEESPKDSSVEEVKEHVRATSRQPKIANRR